MSSTGKKSRSDLHSEYGMACPQCAQADRLSVEITCTATLSIDGTDPKGDHYWDDTSACSCDACNHHGTVEEFRAASDKAVNP